MKSEYSFDKDKNIKIEEDEEELGFVRISPRFKPNEKIVITDENGFTYELNV